MRSIIKKSKFVEKRPSVQTVEPDKLAKEQPIVQSKKKEVRFDDMILIGDDKRQI